ncbi:MAG: penicillin-binding protein 2, partial [Thermoleophilia bacterium]|nr:penicillin-binding protein 2 [Thermoleophilia bacterium]
VRDPQGIPIDVLKLQREHDGKDVRLTIDRVIQQEAERVLLKTMRAYDADSASAIVLNPRTGEILASASVPGVNPVNWGRASAKARKNRVISSSYEPGSTFKIVTVSAALEEGLVTPSTKFDLPYKLKFCDDEKTCTVKESHVRGPVRLSVSDILEESSNIGTIRLAQLIAANRGGKKAINQWISRFGFGAPTGIDFPGEEIGQMLSTSDWSDVSIGNIPIGQGISVTPIQLASAYAAIANDGVLVQPHLLQRIGDEPATAYPRRRVLSAKTAAIMRNLFGNVVTGDLGTGHKAKIDGYSVAGKTGTAQVAGSHGYIPGAYDGSFVGFVPANNPQLVTLVVVNQPKNGYYGGDVAAPAFQEITSFAINYLGIPPDGVM